MPKKITLDRPKRLTVVIDGDTHRYLVHLAARQSMMDERQIPLAEFVRNILEDAALQKWQRLGKKTPIFKDRYDFPGTTIDPDTQNQDGENADAHDQY